MTDIDANALDEDDESEDGEGGAPKRRFSGKVIVLFFVAPAVALVAILGGLYAFGVFGGADSDTEMAATQEILPDPVFYELPEFLVNLQTPGSTTKFLQLRVSLEVADQGQIAELEEVMPRITDAFQIYLRELRPEDFSGSAAIVRLKEELLRRVNFAVQPAHINDVLFKEVVVQ